MAQVYYSDSDSDSCGSYDDGEGEEYSNVDFGTHSLVSFGPQSGFRMIGGQAEEEEGDEYELVGGANNIYGHSFFKKVECKCQLSNYSSVCCTASV